MRIDIPDDLADKALTLAKSEGHGTLSPWLRVTIKRALLSDEDDEVEAQRRLHRLRPGRRSHRRR